MENRSNSPVYPSPPTSSMHMNMPPPMAMMHQQQQHHSSMDPTRPSLGFPLGTALLLLVIFTLSGVTSCCYHWDKFRSLRRSYDAANTDLERGARKDKASQLTSNDDISQSVPVIMPGDEMPRFIALPCPCQPPRPHSNNNKKKAATAEQLEGHHLQLQVQLHPTLPKPPATTSPTETP